MNFNLRCHLCQTAFPATALWVCDKCLGPLEVTYDYETIAKGLSRELIESRPESLWRYRELLPIEGEPRTGLHSGFTPLVRAHRLAARLGVRELYVKDDSVNHPTCSYKDRVVSIAATRAIELGFTVFSCASTGNLAGSVASHAARLGLSCYVFIPDDLEAGKVAGASIYRPRIIAVRGNYDDVNRLCTQVADKYKWGFANINLRAYYAEGAKTYGFEIAEQLGWKFPRHVVSPVAGGTLLPRILKGFEELRTVGLVDGELPAIHAAQAAGCAPVVRALDAGLEFPDPVKPNTIAKSIAIGNPADGFQVLRSVRATGGSGRHGDRRRGHRGHPAPGRDRGHLHRAGRRGHGRGHAATDRARRAAARRIDRHLHHRQWLQDDRGSERSRRRTDPDRPRPCRLRGQPGRAGHVSFMRLEP